LLRIDAKLSLPDNTLLNLSANCHISLNKQREISFVQNYNKNFLFSATFTDDEFAEKVAV